MRTGRQPQNFPAEVMGCIDLQVNGYGGVSFNDDPVQPAEMRKACTLLSAHGVEAFLPTVITDAPDRMVARLQAIHACCEADADIARMVAGIHMEGPFISSVPGYIGAHPRAYAVESDLGLARKLLEAGGGLVRLVTLAPERDGNFKFTRYLAERDILVSAGHTDADLDTLLAARDAGLSMFTHLGNGCPAMMHRHDNIIQRALRVEGLCYGLICDGAHVPWPALGNIIRLAGIDRVFAVTDAIAAAGCGMGRFSFAGFKVDVGEDLAARPPGEDHFAGSAITMPRVRENLAEHLGLTVAEIETMTDRNPRRLLKR